MDIMGPDITMMDGRMVFCMRISQVCGSWFPKHVELFLSDAILNPIKTHVHCFGPFCCIVEFMMPSLVELSILTGVGGCGCPISSSVMLRETAALQLTKMVAHLASEAADITFLMISQVV